MCFLLVGLTGCQSDDRAPAADVAPTPTVTLTGPPRTFVALGDSWPNGAHCGGCRTFMGLYADRLEQSGARVSFVDLTQAVVPGTDKGQTPASLLKDLQSTDEVRRQVTTADIVVIHTGVNDLQQGSEIGAYQSDQCGGTDNSDCLRRLGSRWRQTFEKILAQIKAIRAGRPIAIRLVTAENHFLSDPALIHSFPKDFGPTTGRLIVEQLAQAMCGAAAKAGAKCVDIRPLLNGPSLDQPSKGENAPETHQAVADALVASGLPELG